MENRSVVLENRSKRVVSLSLDHEVFCRDGTCRCTPVRYTSVEHDARTGARRNIERTRRVSPSLTLLPGERSGPLDVAVLGCAEVTALLARGRLTADVAEGEVRS